MTYRQIVSLFVIIVNREAVCLCFILKLVHTLEMSTFSGFLDGIDHVSVDRFTQLNFQSKVFFLSHCHMDHMIGLKDITPENQLPGPLYLSGISQVIIQRRYPAIQNMIPLNLGETTPITISDATNESTELRFTVTAVPAGHCPGSIMLLFEMGDKRVLYTGDFRLCQDDIKGIIALKKFHEKRYLDSLYLDSTFLSSDYKHFPKQRESINTIIKLAEDWLNKHPNNIVVLRPPAAYGYEFLLIELSQHFKFKIHVSNSTYKDYLHIPKLDCHISNTLFHCGRIHLCSSDPNKWHQKSCPCVPDLDERHICIIRPTAMKWRYLSASDEYYEKHSEFSNVYCVCYSNHSSSDEIKYLISYLQPKTVKLNVVPNNTRHRREMFDIVNAVAKEYQDSSKIEEGEASVENNFQRITSFKTRRSMALVVDDEISQLKFKKRPKIMTK